MNTGQDLGMSQSVTPGSDHSRHTLRLRPGWKVALTLILLGVLLSQMDLQRVLEVLGRISPLWLVAVVVVQMADRWLMAWKWRILLNAEHQYIKTAEAFKVYYIAGFQGFIIPFGIGPDLVRFVRLRSSGIPQERLAASLILERAIGSVATAVAAATSFLLLLYLLGGATPGWMIPIVLAVAAGSAASLLFMLNARFRRLVTGLPLARNLIDRFEHSPWWMAIAAYRNRERVLLRFFWWSLVRQYMTVLAVWFTALALGVPLALIGAVAAVPIMQLMEKLPLTVMGLGVREGSSALFLGLVGIGYSEAILCSLVEFTVFGFTLLPAGAWDVLSRGHLIRRRDVSLQGAEEGLSSALEKRQQLR